MPKNEPIQRRYTLTHLIKVDDKPKSKLQNHKTSRREEKIYVTFSLAVNF